MSSVSGSSARNVQDEKLRRTREEYQEKDAEKIKQLQKDRKRVAEQHKAEIDSLKEAHSQDVERLKNAMKVSMSERDRKYQKEIEELRQIQRKQHEKTISENAATTDATKQNRDREIELAEMRRERQRSNMQRNYESELNELQENFKSELEKLREGQEKALKNQRKDLIAQREQETEILRNQRDKEVADVENRLDQTRRYEKATKNDLIRKNRNDTRRLDEHYTANLQEEKANSAQVRNFEREAYQDSLKALNERYKREKQSDVDDISESQEAYRKEINERYDTDLRKAEAKLRAERALNLRERDEMTKKQSLEKAGIREQANANIEVYKKQAEMAQQSVQNAHTRELEKVNKGNEVTLSHLDKQNRSQRQIEVQRYAEALDLTEMTLKNQNTQIQNNSNLRVKRAYEENARTQQQMEKYYVDKIEDLKKLHHQQLAEQRESLIKERTEALSRSYDLMQKQEVDFAQRENKMVIDHEDEVKALKNQLVIQKRDLDRDHQKIVEELKKAHQIELETQQIQNENKVRQAQLSHDQEVQRLNRAHQEKLRELAAQTRKA